MYKSDIKWALLTSCVNPAYSSYCMDKAFKQRDCRVSLTGIAFKTLLVT
jgi:hypothetical protein